MTYKLLGARFANALTFSSLSAWLALSYGPAGWSTVVWFQTVLIFLPLLTLGYNEGFGLELAKNQNLKLRTSLIFKCNLAISFGLLILGVAGYSIIKFPAHFLLLPFGLAALLNFSLLRMYFRSTGDMNGLVNFYFLNSFFLICAGLVTKYLSNPMWFVVFTHASQLVSSSIALRKTNGTLNRSPPTTTQKIHIISTLRRTGLPLMLAGLLTEGVFHADRLLVALSSQTHAISLIGVAMLASKAGFMALSVINVINFKNISNLISMRSKAGVAESLMKQAVTGFLLTSGLITTAWLLTSTSVFQTTFPLYSRLNFFIFWQGLFLVSFSFMIPLATFLNLLRGGQLHFVVMAAVCSLSIAGAIVFGYHGSSLVVFYVMLNALLFTSALFLMFIVQSELRRW